MRHQQQQAQRHHAPTGVRGVHLELSQRAYFQYSDLFRSPGKELRDITGQPCLEIKKRKDSTLDRKEDIGELRSLNKRDKMMQLMHFRTQADP